MTTPDAAATALALRTLPQRTAVWTAKISGACSTRNPAARASRTLPLVRLGSNAGNQGSQAPPVWFIVEEVLPGGAASRLPRAIGLYRWTRRVSEGSSMDRIPMTREGYDKLKAELQRMETVE